MREDKFREDSDYELSSSRDPSNGIIDRFRSSMVVGGFGIILGATALLLLEEFVPPSKVRGLQAENTILYQEIASQKQEIALLRQANDNSSVRIVKEGDVVFLFSFFADVPSSSSTMIRSFAFSWNEAPQDGSEISPDVVVPVFARMPNKSEAKNHNWKRNNAIGVISPSTKLKTRSVEIIGNQVWMTACIIVENTCE